MKAKKCRRIRKHEIDTALEMHRDGAKVAKIAEFLGCNPRRVSYIIRNHLPTDNQRGPRKLVTQGEVDDVIRLRGAGKTAAEIAEALGCKASRVRTIVSNYLPREMRSRRRLPGELLLLRCAIAILRRLGYSWGKTARVLGLPTASSAFKMLDRITTYMTKQEREILSALMDAKNDSTALVSGMRKLHAAMRGDGALCTWLQDALAAHEAASKKRKAN